MNDLARSAALRYGHQSPATRGIKWYMKNSTADPRKSWELDAMHPADLRARVRSAIVSHMDMDTWNRALMIEAAEKESMRELPRRLEEAHREAVEMSSPVDLLLSRLDKPREGGPWPLAVPLPGARGPKPSRFR